MECSFVTAARHRCALDTAKKQELLQRLNPYLAFLETLTTLPLGISLAVAMAIVNDYGLERLSSEADRVVLRDLAGDAFLTFGAGWLILAIYAQRNDVAKALLEMGADANGRDAQRGLTCLHIAVVMNNRASINLLIQYGAVLDLFDTQDDVTPLQSAAFSGHTDAIEVLVAKGASIERTNGAGWNALKYFDGMGSPKVSRNIVGEGKRDRLLGRIQDLLKPKQQPNSAE